MLHCWEESKPHHTTELSVQACAVKRVRVVAVAEIQVFMRCLSGIAALQGRLTRASVERQAEPSVLALSHSNRPMIRPS